METTIEWSSQSPKVSIQEKVTCNIGSIVRPMRNCSLQPSKVLIFVTLLSTKKAIYNVTMNILLSFYNDGSILPFEISLDSSISFHLQRSIVPIYE